MNIWSFTCKNLTRKLFRSGALVLAIALVVSLLFAGAISMKSVSTSIQLGAQRLGADLMVVPKGSADDARTTLIAGKPSVFYMPETVLEQVRKVKGVRRASPQLFIKSSDFECCTFVDVLLVAFDPATDFTVTPWLKDTLKRPLGKNEIVIGRSIPVAIGATMTFYGTKLTVAGDLATTGFQYIDNGAYMTMETAREIIKNSKLQAEGPEAMKPLAIEDNAISAVLVELTPDVTPERAQVFIEYEIEGVQGMSAQDVIGTVKKQLYVLLQAIFGLGVALWLITLVLIGIVFSMIVNERQREMGLLRSLGAKRRNIFAIITLESVLLSLVGGVLGIVAGGSVLLVLKHPIKAAFNLPSLWPDTIFIALVAGTALGMALLSGVVAVFYPAYKCSRMEPYAAIRKGE